MEFTDYSMNVTYLTFEGHVDLEHYRYIYFIFTLIIYILIICFNSVVIFVIHTNKHLHEPMYIFIAALLCNALYGATAFYPKLLSDLLSEQQTISYKACLLQAFCLYSYGESEFTLLSAMAYDRYVSICKPLHYTTLISMSTVRKLIFFSWFWPSCQVAIAIILTSQLQLCKYKLNRIYCDNYSIVKLSCGEISLNNFYGLFFSSIAVFPPVIFIIYSYIRILSVCLKNSYYFRRKALQTCLPHIFIFINFTVIACFEVINNRLESKLIPHTITMILSVIALFVPPLFNPIIYGLKLQDIFYSIRRLIKWEKRVQAFF